MMRKTRHLLLMAAMLLCSVATSAHDFEVDGIYYNITSSTDLTAEVTHGSNKYSGKVIIPSSITYNRKTYNVTKIADHAFKECKQLDSISIPNGVTSIGKNAFDYCVKLTSINIPEGVTNIEEWAFYYCIRLTSISIPESVTHIGNNAFHGCSSLTSINIPESITSISDWLFCDCKNITSINISGEIESIGTSAFYNCNSLTSIDIPESLTHIRDWAFYNCSNLTSINIPEGITSISDWCFVGCSNLTSINIPESATAIGYRAFSDCSSITSINIPKGIINIGEHAFYGCSDLAEVHVSDIDAWCNISFSSQDANPLYYATNLYLNGNPITELSISDTITIIKEYAFYRCNNLTSIRIPKSVVKIGNSAFYGCSNLTTIICEATTPPEIENTNTFHEVDKSILLYVPQHSISAYQHATYWHQFTNIQAISEDTAIEYAPADNAQQPTIIYDLQGRRVENPGKGVYIVNGKKVLIK